MSTKRSGFITQNRNIVLIALGVAFILLLPLLAMQITHQVAWSLADFVVAGALLFGTGLAYDLLTRKAGNGSYRAAVAVALGAALLLVWVNLAVGIIGSEDNPANLMYVGVLAVLVIGALVAHFRPAGMARAQTLAVVIALIAGNTQDVLQLLMVNALFVALWVGSALLFRRADTTLGRRLV